jgi:hypothetical protein
MEQEIDAIEMSEEDVSGPFNVMVMAYQSNVDTSLNQTNSYVLFTNAGFLSDSTLGEDAFLNSKYLLTVMNFVSEDEDAIIIDDKDYTTDTLVLAGWQKSVLFWLLLIIIPVGSLAAGFIVWARRRHM